MLWVDAGEPARHLLTCLGHAQNVWPSSSSGSHTDLNTRRVRSSTLIKAAAALCYCVLSTTSGASIDTTHHWLRRVAIGDITICNFDRSVVLMKHHLWYTLYATVWLKTDSLELKASCIGNFCVLQDASAVLLHICVANTLVLTWSTFI